jgi:hypothetical protein
MLRAAIRAAINITIRSAGIQRYDGKVRAMWQRQYDADYRLACDGALASLVSAGEAAILTSTSLTGCSVQACVT